MTWRGSTSPLDRLFACLPYLLPLIEVIISFGRAFFLRFPELQIILFPLQPFIAIYAIIIGSIPFGGFLVFLALYFLVVRNESIQHFIRFNAMQSILIGIGVSLASLVWFDLVAKIVRIPLVNETVAFIVFLGTVAAVIYSVVQSAFGRYAEIPPLSDAAYVQTR
ncbi:MAG: Tic20 family protein [Oculatellaceae cyanobacterium bins.114]|nr:Tic20 family protein [Oculatellaceae cyanobacterium bins.114]